MPTQCLLTMKFVVTVYPDLIGCAWLKKSNLWIYHVHGILIVFFVKTSPFPPINVASMTISQLPILLHDIHCWCHKYHPIAESRLAFYCFILWILSSWLIYVPVSQVSLLQFCFRFLNWQANVTKTKYLTSHFKVRFVKERLAPKVDKYKSINFFWVEYIFRISST